MYIVKANFIFQILELVIDDDLPLLQGEVNRFVVHDGPPNSNYFYPRRLERRHESLGLNRSKSGSIFSLRLALVIVLGSACL